MIGDPGCLDTRGFTMPFGTKLSNTRKGARCAGLGLRVPGVSLLLVIDFFFFSFKAHTGAVPGLGSGSGFIKLGGTHATRVEIPFESFPRA